LRSEAIVDVSPEKPTNEVSVEDIPPDQDCHWIGIAEYAPPAVADAKQGHNPPIDDSYTMPIVDSNDLVGRFPALTRHGHMARHAKCVYGYLSKMKGAIIRVRTNEPDYSALPDQAFNREKNAYTNGSIAYLDCETDDVGMYGDQPTALLLARTTYYLSEPMLVVDPSRFADRMHRHHHSHEMSNQGKSAQPIPVGDSSRHTDNMHPHAPRVDCNVNRGVAITDLMIVSSDGVIVLDPSIKVLSGLLCVSGLLCATLPNLVWTADTDWNPSMLHHTPLEDVGYYCKHVIIQHSKTTCVVATLGGASSAPLPSAGNPEHGGGSSTSNSYRLHSAVRSLMSYSTALGRHH